MTHAWQDKNSGAMEDWKRQFWNGESSPKTSSVSDYGNTNPYEDMSESVKEYYLHGTQMKSSDPKRYNFIKQKIMRGKEY
ncbi:hypothetical protein HYY75_04495 [bacterium]|nr:hypothetical protein [bacterium]